MSPLDTLPGLLERLDTATGELDELAREIEAEASLEAAASYSEIWRSIDEVAEAADIAGLSEIAEFICFNAGHVVESCRESESRPEHIRTLNGVLPVLKAFVRSPLDAETLGGLVCYLQEADWPVPMGEDQAYSVMERLLMQMQEDEQAAAGESPDDDGEPAKPETASRDFRLSIPDDVPPQLADAFFNEVPQLAEELTGHVQRLSTGAGGRDDVLRAQRLAHTIKGSSNVTGVPAVATLMHSCEALLESLYQSGAVPGPDLGQVLMDTVDCLASQLEFLGGRGPAPDNAETLVDTLDAWLAPDRAPVGGPTTAGEPAEQEAAPATAPATVESMRVAATLIENLLRQAGEVSISTVQLQGLGESLNRRMDTLVKQQALMWERLNAIQELVELRGIAGTRRPAVGQAVGQVASQAAGRSLSGAAEPMFDALEMDEYNELHTAANFLAESITDAREYTTGLKEDVNKLKTMLKQQDVLSRELNESVMSTRMVPFRSLVSRLERVVRQTARSTGKSVNLEITGEDVLVDSAVLNRLTDPLMHMLRNAVDHGIEPPEERLRAGKPDSGTVSIRVERHGDNVSLRIRDDGRGLDYEKIRRLGVERGLISGDPESLSEMDLARLVLLPGFSTRDEATQISGRGIGMDVVNTAVMEQRGTLDIVSEPGSGIDVTLRVPMTLISVHTLLVRNSGVVLGIPSSSVQQLIFSDLGQWRHEEDGAVFEFEERDYKVYLLSNLVGIDTPMPDLHGPRPLPLLLVQGEREHYAVILEEVLDNRYLVVKRLGRYVPKITGVIGGAILGDGSVAGVLDLRELLRYQSESARDALQNIGRHTLAERRQELPLVLVVDDSVSARRSLAELVADAGYRAVTAIDGLEALNSIEKERPAAILLDMEMPRMNGLELAAHLRADNQTSDIPLIMITSRSTEKHRRQAETAGVDRYFTKPYQEDRLVEDLNQLVQ